MITTQQISTYRTLRDMVLSGELRPGTAVVERGLCEQLGVRRGPVREALIRLEAEGLIGKIIGVGYEVADYGAEFTELADDIYSIRLAIETSALRRILKRRDRKAIVSLTLLCDALEEAAASGDGAAVAEADAEFHRELLALSESHILENFYRATGLPMFPRPTSDPKESAQTVSDHRAIVSALAAGDEPRALDALRSHMQSGARWFREQAAGDWRSSSGPRERATR